MQLTELRAPILLDIARETNLNETLTDSASRQAAAAAGTDVMDGRYAEHVTTIKKIRHEIHRLSNQHRQNLLKSLCFGQAALSDL